MAQSYFLGAIVGIAEVDCLKLVLQIKIVLAYFLRQKGELTGVYAAPSIYDHLFNSPGRVSRVASEFYRTIRKLDCLVLLEKAKFKS